MPDDFIVVDVFPAQAGVILRYPASSITIDCVSRASGGDPWMLLKMVKLFLCFPRKRG